MIVDRHKHLASYRVDVDMQTKKTLDEHLAERGQKKGWWIRQAILEKLARETQGDVE